MPFTPQSSTHTGAQVVTEVRRTLGDLSGVLFSDPDGLAWVNAAQREIATNLDLFGEATVTLDVDQRDYVIPVEIAQRIRDLETILVNGVLLEPLTYQQAQAKWMRGPEGAQYPESGRPNSWFQRNQTVTIVPAPNAEYAAYEMTVQFARNAVDLTALTDNLDVPDSHYNLLVSYVQMRAYQLTQETELMAAAAQEHERGLREQQGRERRSQINTYPALEPDEDLY